MALAHPISAAPISLISRRQLLRNGAVLGAGTLAAGAPFSVFAKAPAASPQWPGVSAMVEEFVGQGRLPNMIATLGWQQDAPQTIARGNRGYGVPGAVGPDTLYRIYSMTKPITGMAAMICVDEGLIGLDQPIAQWLPSFAEMQVQKRYDGPITPDNLEPAKRQITLRHLLTHTAGLGYSIVQQGPLSEAYTKAGITPGYVSNLPLPQAIFTTPPAPDLPTFADNLSTLPLVAQPGERWSYSVSLDLIGRLIEVASGMAFDQFLQQRIFTPCGMDSTGFQVKAQDIGRFVPNYFYLEGFPLPLDLPDSSVYLPKPAFPFGGAGLVSTARDYDRFLQMLGGYGMIEGRRVMSAEAVRMGTSDLMPPTVLPGAGFREGTMGYGAGGLVGLAGTEAEGLFGWSGAAGTVGMVHMGLGLRLGLMAQYMPLEYYNLHLTFPRIVLDDVMTAHLP